MVDVEQAPRCANHPSVETYVSCSSCGKPICPDCMVPAPVGIKCRDCARQPRSALVRLKPERAVRAVLVAAALAGAIGFALSLLLSIAYFGFLAFILAALIGMGVGNAVKRASGYYMSPLVGAIAAGGALLGYVLPYLLYGVVHSNRTLATNTLAYQVAFGAIAAFFAYRQAS